MQAAQCLIENNVAANSTLDAMFMTSAQRNLIVGNSLTASRVGLHLDVNSLQNNYGSNSMEGNGPAGLPCVASTCAPDNFCDENGNNASFGDNLAAGPPPC